MSDNIKAITAKKEPNQQLIERLEILLDQAKSGELQSVAYSGICLDGSRIRAWWNNDDTFAMAGGIQILLHEFINNEVEGVIDRD